MAYEYLRLDRSTHLRQWIHFKRMLSGFYNSSAGCILVRRSKFDHQEMLGYLQVSGILYRWCRKVSPCYSGWLMDSGNECYCDNTANPSGGSKIDESKCNKPCPGGDATGCG